MSDEGHPLRRLKGLLDKEMLRLAGDAAFLFACRVIGAALVLVTQIMLARWMGAEQLGWYVYAFAWCVFLSVLAGCGFPSAAVRFINSSAARGSAAMVRGYFRRLQQTGIGVSLVLTAIAATVVIVVRSPSHDTPARVMLLALLAVPLFTMINVYGSVALAMSWFRTAFVPNVVLRPAALLAAIALIWYSTARITADQVMAMHGAAALAVVLFLLLTVRRRLAREFPGAERAYEWSLWRRTAPPLLVINLFLNYFPEVNIIAVGALLPADELAVYNASFRIAFLIAFGIHAVNAITMPRTARLHAVEDMRRLQRTTTYAARLQLLWSFSAVIGLAIFGRPVLALFGPDFVAGYSALMILACAQLAHAAFGPVTQLLSMTGHQNQCLLVYLSSFAAMLVLNVLLIGPLGIEGAALAVVFTLVLQAAWLYLLAVSRLGIHPSALGVRLRTS